MRVLSIDLDFIMSSLRDDDVLDMNPITNWERWRDDNEGDILKPNVDRILWLFDVFTKALSYCHDVEFSHDHDAILYRLEKENNIDIINIDHHNDITNGVGSWVSNHSIETYADDVDILKKEYDQFRNDRVMEGNWLGWLHSKNKLSKMTWVHDDDGVINLDSDSMREIHERMLNHDGHRLSDEILSDFNLKLESDYVNTFDLYDIWRKNFYGDIYQSFHIDDFKIKSYKFDYIFVCLSPPYIPKEYWHYFTMFMIAYENMTGKKLKMINQKYQITCRYREVNKYIFPKKIYDAKIN